MQKVYFKVIDSLIDLIFLADLISMFFATYVDNKVTDRNKQEIWSPKKIALHYVLSKRFYLDFGSFLGVFKSL